MLLDVMNESWAALTSGDGEVDSAPVQASGPAGGLPSRFAVEDVATASVATALRAATALRPELQSTPIRLDRSHVADACRSERFFAVDGKAPGAGFAPLSRFWPAADGWVRTHANYPWHQRALLDALECPPTPTRSATPWVRPLHRCMAKSSKSGSLLQAVSAVPSGRSRRGAATRRAGPSPPSPCLV